MVSDNKEELKSEVTVEEEGLTEEEQIKAKLDAVIRAKAKEYARAKFEAEKKAREEVFEEREKALSEKLAEIERIKKEKEEKEAAERAAQARVRKATAVKEAAIKAAEDKKRKLQEEQALAEQAELEERKRQEAEKKAADKRLRLVAARLAAQRMHDERLARKAEKTMDDAAREAAARVRAAEEEKQAARMLEIAELEEMISRKEAEQVPVFKDEPDESEESAYEGNASEAAYKYAKYLREHNLKPGDATFVNPEDIGILTNEEEIEEPDEYSEDDLDYVIRKAEQRQKRIRDEIEKKKWDKVDEERKLAARAKYERENGAGKHGFRENIRTFFAAPIYLHDSIQDACDNFLERLYRDLVSGIYKIVRGYRQSQKTIGLNLLLVCIVCGVIVTLLNFNTVYEYAYNGKVLGYVENQDDVTNVLSIAGEKLNSLNEESAEKIEFEAGDNITFKAVNSKDKDIDDADDTVNKLAFMTDIEVEAYGIYDGDNLVTVVKSNSAAENLLEEVKSILGTPDEGMEVISVDFTKPLSIKTVKVLLTSVQSNTAARKQMTEGADIELYHLVEADETMDSITDDFGVSAQDIYDEENEKVVKELNVGDKICIRKEVEPVSVKMVEQGKMKEIVPYETIEKKTKKYYKGDEVVDVDGVDGIQIFDGTITKVGGKITKRKTNSLEIIREKVDEVILVGIAKRPKTAPTGIFKNPMVPGTYVITSHMGYRWGRSHEGVDMGASTGTAVYASDGGTVSYTGYSGGYGNLIIIDHGNGKETRYGHLSSIGVSTGQKVYQGQYIGAVGSTGRSTGPHLHFEIRSGGTPINPETNVSDGL